MKCLVCESREPRHNTAVIHVDGNCRPQRDRPHSNRSGLSGPYACGLVSERRGRGQT